MSNNITWAIFIFIWALLYSLYEIEVEGKYGWAQKLPVYRYIKPNSLFPLGLSSWNFLMLFFVFISLFHPLIFSKLFGLNMKEKHIYVLVISLLVWVIVEDYMWFNFNPYYNKDPNSKEYKYLKLKQFNKENVKWHKFGFLGLPKVFYLIFVLIFINIGIFYYKKNIIDPENDICFIRQFITYIILSIIAIYFSKHYCIWYMKNLDKRKKL